MWQDILTFWNNLPPFVPFIIKGAGGLLLSLLVYRWRHELLYWRRYELPNLDVSTVSKADRSDWQVVGPDSKVGSSDWVSRSVNFYLPGKRAQLRWLIDEIGIKPRRKLIAEPGEAMQIRKELGRRSAQTEIAYSPGGDWTDRVRYDPPVHTGKLLLHPDAPKHLTFSVRVCLRYRPRIKRKMEVPL